VLLALLARLELAFKDCQVLQDQLAQQAFKDFKDSKAALAQLV
jgi:hypothetical protein